MFLSVYLQIKIVVECSLVLWKLLWELPYVPTQKLYHQPQEGFTETLCGIVSERLHLRESRLSVERKQCSYNQGVMCNVKRSGDCGKLSPRYTVWVFLWENHQGQWVSVSNSCRHLCGRWRPTSTMAPGTHCLSYFTSHHFWTGRLLIGWFTRQGATCLVK